VEQASVQVPAELVMGPRCDLWADPEHFAAFERASPAAERMTAHDSCMISGRRADRPHLAAGPGTHPHRPTVLAAVTNLGAPAPLMSLLG